MTRAETGAAPVGGFAPRASSSLRYCGLAHIIRRLVEAVFELGIESSFWSNSALGFNDKSLLKTDEDIEALTWV
jgi:hypothetical protein